MQETQVQSLVQEDPLEKEMVTLQYSCLGNFMDRESWWATVHGVAKSWTHDLVTEYGCQQFCSPWLCPRQNNLGKKEKYKSFKSERKKQNYLWRWHDLIHEEP